MDEVAGMGAREEEEDEEDEHEAGREDEEVVENEGRSDEGNTSRLVLLLLRLLVRCGRLLTSRVGTAESPVRRA